MAQPQFSSVLDQPSNLVDRVSKQLPVGSYTAVVSGPPKIDKSTKKGTEYSEYTMKILEAGEDVDEAELDEFLTKADGTKKRLQDCTIRATFWHTDEALGRLARFLDHLDGLSPEDAAQETKKLKQRVDESVGKTCIIHVKHEPWQSGEAVSARVASTSLIEE